MSSPESELDSERKMGAGAESCQKKVLFTRVIVTEGMSSSDVGLLFNDEALFYCSWTSPAQMLQASFYIFTYKPAGLLQIVFFLDEIIKLKAN